MPIEDWPENDRTALEAALSVSDLLDDGPFAHWSPASVSMHVYAYGRWLQFLASRNELLLRLRLDFA
jgi:hypothetical protein